jgi:hypothetical protein
MNTMSPLRRLIVVLPVVAILLIAAVIRVGVDGLVMM